MTPPIHLRYRWLTLIALLMLLMLGSASLTFGQAPSNELPPPPPLRDERFGAVQTYNAPDVATAAGVGWTRVLFLWHQIQPTNNREWNHYFFPDRLLNGELAAERKMVGVILGTPPWASASGSLRAVPSGLELPYDHPENHWGQFVMRLVERYEGKIDHWIMWNEPDVWDDNHPGKTWDGTLEDYVKLQKIGYQATKAANPNATVFLTATTYWWDVEYGRELYFPRLLQAIRSDPEATANNHFFDIASLHLYFNPEQIYHITSLFRHQLDQHGFAHKPLWINETNAPPSSDPYHPAPYVRFQITLEEQSYFLFQAWGMALAGGADRLSFYKLQDEVELPIGEWPYGMSRKDGTLRPVFWSYRTLVSYLAGYQKAQLYREGYIRRVVVPRGDLGTTTIVWNTGHTWKATNISATYNHALLVDPFGPLQLITPTNGQYTLALPPSTNQIVGGRPYMIVEGSGTEIHLSRPDANLIPPPPLIPPVQITPTPSPPPQLTDWAFLNGRFFTQATNGEGGFSVIDDSQANFWSEYQRLGGAQTVGYPISRRYLHNGFVTQAFQKLILQWRPDRQQAWPLNLFDELSAANLDDTLYSLYQIPPRLPSAELDSPNSTWEEIVTRRQTLLNANPAIRARYFSVSTPLTLFGLPTSRVEDMGNHYALRTQRAVFQQWKEAVPWAKTGEVTIANGGSLAQEAGWLPDAALEVEKVPSP